MIAVRKQIAALYVDRVSQQWVVLDGDGKFWLIPNGDVSWVQRQPFYPTEDTKLEPVPGHYKYMLGLPT